MKRWFIWGGSAIAVVLVVAAVVVPTLTGYSPRAKISEVLLALSQDRREINEFYAKHRRLPKDATEAGLSPLATKYIQSRTYDARSSELRAVMRDIPGNEGKSITLKAEINADEITWRCIGTGIRERDLPMACRDTK